MTGLVAEAMLPTWSGMGREPAGVMFAAACASSSAAPGQKKPLAGQSSGAALPVGAQKFGATGRQPLSEVRLRELDQVPPGHGTGVVELRGQYEPRSHVAHAVPLASVRYEPPSHGAHSALPADAATVPGGHGVGANEPVEQLEPAGQIKQPLSEARLRESDQVPPGHGTGVGEPRGQ